MIRPVFAMLGLLAALTAATSARAATFFSVQTGIQGAQTQIDVNHTSTWSFTTGAAWSFGGGTFEMKAGPQTSANITLSIFEGTNFSAPAFGTINLTSAGFCGQLGNCQQFGAVSFLFGTALALKENTTYFVDLTSTAVDNASRQYFIKGTSSALRFVDADGNPMPTTFLASDAGSVPEPVGLAVLGLGVALGAARVRKARA